MINFKFDFRSQIVYKTRYIENKRPVYGVLFPDNMNFCARFYVFYNTK